MSKKEKQQPVTAVNIKSFNIITIDKSESSKSESINGIDINWLTYNLSEIEDKYIDLNSWYIITNSSSSFKSNLISLLGQSSIDYNRNDQYIILGEAKKSSKLREIISSDFGSHYLSNSVVLSGKALSAINKVNCSTLSEFIYRAEKSCLIEKYISNNSKEYNEGILQIWKNKLSISFNYYSFWKTKNWALGAFILSALFSFFYITNSSKRAGISGDDFVQYYYGKCIASYQLDRIGIDLPLDTNELKAEKMYTLAKAYPQVGKDIVKLEDPYMYMHLYGSSFDAFTAALVHLMDIEDFIQFRHWWNAVFGFLIFFYGALTIRRLTKGSWVWASISMFILLFTPRLFGESLNNPKDVPFALGYIMSLYYAIKFYQHFPRIKWSTLFGLVFGIALGISIRIGGLLSIAIVGLYMGLKFIENQGWSNVLKFNLKGLKPYLTSIIGISIGAYILGIFFWPYGWDAPIENPKKALDAFTHYQVSLRQLFEGVLYDSNNLPGYYLTKYLWITLPLVTLIGIGLNLFIISINRKITMEEFLIIFAAIFPVFYIWINKSGVYGGMRHILFTVAPFVVAGIMGYYKIQSKYLSKKPIFGIILPALLMLLPAKFVNSNPNFSYIYFNEIIGGVEGAYGDYEMDYYLASIKPSCEFLIETEIAKHPEKEYQINTYALSQVKYFMRKYPNVNIGFVRYDQRSEQKWDYSIFYNAYMDKARLTGGYYPPVGTVFTPVLEGKPMGCVIKNISNIDYQGIQALNKEQNPDKAIGLLKEYIKLDTSNNEICQQLATAYTYKSNQNPAFMDSAIYYSNRALKFYPEYSPALFTLYQVAMNQQKFDLAEKSMITFTQSRPQDLQGWTMLADAQFAQGKGTEGIKNLHRAITINPLYDKTYYSGARYYQSKGDENNLRLWGPATRIQSKNQSEQIQAIESIKLIYEGVTGKDFVPEDWFNK